MNPNRLQKPPSQCAHDELLYDSKFRPYHYEGRSARDVLSPPRERGFFIDILQVRVNHID